MQCFYAGPRGEAGEAAWLLLPCRSGRVLRSDSLESETGCAGRAAKIHAQAGSGALSTRPRRRWRQAASRAPARQRAEQTCAQPLLLRPPQEIHSLALAVQALDQGVTQVVVIAAGYDTRAYRFYRPGVQASRRRWQLP